MVRISKSLVVLLTLGLLSGCANRRDQEDARLAAARIHAQIQSRSFAAMYDEAADGFRTVTKAQFVTDMHELEHKLGPVRNVKEVAYLTGLDSRAGRTHSLVFDFQCESERIRETLVFVRGEDQKMLLWKFGVEPIN